MRTLDAILVTVRQRLVMHDNIVAGELSIRNSFLNGVESLQLRHGRRIINFVSVHEVRAGGVIVRKGHPPLYPSFSPGVDFHLPMVTAH
mgnify:CR=1 FL=1